MYQKRRLSEFKDDFQPDGSDFEYIAPHDIDGLEIFYSWTTIKQLIKQLRLKLKNLLKQLEPRPKNPVAYIKKVYL